MTSPARLRCKHTSATWYRWTGDDWEVVGHLSGPPLVGLTGALFQRVVCDCGHWLPLGEANDEGEAVAIEKRAAHFAAEWSDDIWLGGFVGLGTVSPEGQHADLIERDIAAGNRDKYPRDLNDYLAGHLALCIVEHDKLARAED